MSYSLKSIGSWFKFIKNKVGFLDIYDIGILKVTMLLIGLIFGSLYSKTVRKLAPIFAFFSVIGSVYLIIKVFLKDSVL